jgi:hypothetical protein
MPASRCMCRRFGACCIPIGDSCSCSATCMLYPSDNAMPGSQRFINYNTFTQDVRYSSCMEVRERKTRWQFVVKFKDKVGVIIYIKSVKSVSFN